MATKTITTRDTTPAVTIEKRQDGQYEAMARVQTDGEERRVAITPAELVTIGTSAERTAVLAWLVKAYNFAVAKDGFA